MERVFVSAKGSIKWREEIPKYHPEPFCFLFDKQSIVDSPRLETHFLFRLAGRAVPPDTTISPMVPPCELKYPILANSCHMSRFDSCDCGFYLRVSRQLGHAGSVSRAGPCPMYLIPPTKIAFPVELLR